MSVASRWMEPLDSARRVAWRWSARTAWGRRALHDRAYRVEILAHAHMLVAFGLVLVAPLWLMLLGPLLLGVPHVASDLRYFVLQPPYRIRWRAVFLAPLALMVLVRSLSWAGVPWSPTWELGLGITSCLALLWLVPLSPMRRGVATVGLLVLWWVVHHNAWTALLIFAHAHNVIAMALWLGLYAKVASWWRVARIAAVWLAAVALLMSGLFDDFWTNVPAIGGMTLWMMESSLAPDWLPPLSVRAVMVFGFAQSVHYAIWLRLVPQTLDPRPVPATFARSVERLELDWGRAGVIALAVLAVAVPLLGLVWDAEGARVAYLVAVVFHGWLEVAAAILWMAGGWAIATTRQATQ